MLIDAVVTLQKTDHSLQRGRVVWSGPRYLSYSSVVVDGQRPLLEVRGRTGVNCSSLANKAHVQI